MTTSGFMLLALVLTPLTYLRRWLFASHRVNEGNRRQEPDLALTKQISDRLITDLSGRLEEGLLTRLKVMAAGGRDDLNRSDWDVINVTISEAFRTYVRGILSDEMRRTRDGAPQGMDDAEDEPWRLWQDQGGEAGEGS